MKYILLAASIVLFSSCSSEDSDVDQIVTLTGNWSYYSLDNLRNDASKSFSDLHISSDTFKVVNTCDYFMQGEHQYTIHDYKIVENSKQEFFASFKLYIEDNVYHCKLSKRSDYQNKGYLTIESEGGTISYAKH